MADNETLTEDPTPTPTREPRGMVAQALSTAGPAALRNMGAISKEDRESIYGVSIEVPDVDRYTPVGFKERMDFAVTGGVQQLRGDVQRFGAIASFLSGDDENAQKRLNAAAIYDDASAELMGAFTPFGDFLDNPTPSGMIEQVTKAMGQVTPMMMTSLISGFTGAGIQALGANIISAASKKVTKDVMNDIIKKKLQGKVLDANENAILNSAYKTLQNAGSRVKNVGYGNLAKVRGAGTKATQDLRYGAFAGSGSQEFVVGSSQALAEFEDGGIELTKKEALAALGLGIPQTALGLIGDSAIVGPLFKRFSKNYVKAVAAGDKAGAAKFAGWLKEAAKGFAIGSVTESATELAQEELFIQQRFAIDPTYTQEEANLRRAESAFAGAVAGGAPRAGISVAAKVIDESRAMAQDVREQRDIQTQIRQVTNKNIGPNTEPFAHGVAQLEAVVNPNFTRKEAAIFELDGTDRNSAKFKERIDSLVNSLPAKDRKKLLVQVLPDGNDIVVFRKDNKNVAAKIANLPNFDYAAKANVLNLTEAIEKGNSQERTVVIRNKAGLPVMYQAVSSPEMEQATLDQFNIDLPEGHTVSAIDTETFMKARFKALRKEVIKEGTKKINDEVEEEEENLQTAPEQTAPEQIIPEQTAPEENTFQLSTAPKSMSATSKLENFLQNESATGRIFTKDIVELVGITQGQARRAVKTLREKNIIELSEKRNQIRLKPPEQKTSVAQSLTKKKQTAKKPKTVVSKGKQPQEEEQLKQNQQQQAASDAQVFDMSVQDNADVLYEGTPDGSISNAELDSQQAATTGENLYDWEADQVVQKDMFVKAPLLVKQKRFLSVSDAQKTQADQPDISRPPKIADGVQEFTSTASEPSKILSRAKYRLQNEKTVASHLASVYGISRLDNPRTFSKPATVGPKPVESLQEYVANAEGTRLEVGDKLHLGEYKKLFSDQIIKVLPVQLLAAMNELISNYPANSFIPEQQSDGTWKIKADDSDFFGTTEHTRDKVEEAIIKAQDSREFKTPNFYVKLNEESDTAAPSAPSAPTKVISGGQTGADIIFSKVAKAAGLEIGGLLPKGFRTLEGNKPGYAQEFNMEEDSSRDYPPRTSKNVANSDGTIILVKDPKNLGRGSNLTKNAAMRQDKPYLIITPNTSASVIGNWINTNNIKTLNGAGNRDLTNQDTQTISNTLKEVFGLPPTAPSAPTVERVNILSPELAKANPDKIYLFGDNDQRKGTGPRSGQAVIRNEKNSLGIRTKKAPNNNPTSFYTDAEYAENIQKIDEDFAKIPLGKTIVIPTDGFGTGRAGLKKRAPKTLAYINSKIAELETKAPTPSAPTDATKYQQVQLDTLLYYGNAYTVLENTDSKDRFVPKTDLVKRGFPAALTLLDAANYGLHYSQNGRTFESVLTQPTTSPMYKEDVAINKGKKITLAKGLQGYQKSNIPIRKFIGSDSFTKNFSKSFYLVPKQEQNAKFDGVIVMSPKTTVTASVPSKPSGTKIKSEFNRKIALSPLDSNFNQLQDLIATVENPQFARENKFKPNETPAILIMTDSTTPQEIRAWIDSNKIYNLKIEQAGVSVGVNALNTTYLYAEKIRDSFNEVNTLTMFGGKKVLANREQTLDLEQLKADYYEREEATTLELERVDVDEMTITANPIGGADVSTEVKILTFDEGTKAYFAENNPDKLYSQIVINNDLERVTDIQMFSQQRKRELPQGPPKKFVRSDSSAIAKGSANERRRIAELENPSSVIPNSNFGINVKTAAKVDRVIKAFDQILKQNVKGGVSENITRTVININELLNPELTENKLALKLAAMGITRNAGALLLPSITIAEGTRKISPLNLLKNQAYDMRDNKKLGKFIAYADQEVIFIDIKDNMSNAQISNAVAAYAHELGHGIMTNELNKTLLNEDGRGIKKRLLDEWNKDRAKLDADHVWNNPEYGFQEYFADKVGRVLLDLFTGQLKSKGKKNGATAFIKRVAKMIQQAWKDMNIVLKRRLGVRNEVFTEYVTKTIKSYKDSSKNSMGYTKQAVIYDMVLKDVSKVKKIVKNVAPLRRLKQQALQVIRENPDLFPRDWTKATSHFLWTADNRLRKLFAGTKDKLPQQMYNQSNSREAKSHLNARGDLIRKRQNAFLDLFTEDGITDENAIREILKDAEQEIDPTKLKTSTARKVKKFFNDFYNDVIKGSGDNDLTTNRINFRNFFYPRIIAIATLRESPKLQEDLANLLQAKNPGKEPTPNIEINEQGLPIAIPQTWLQVVETIVAEEETNPDNHIDGADAMAVGMAKNRGELFKSVKTQELRNIGVLEDPGVAALKYIEDMTKRMDYLEKVRTDFLPTDFKMLEKRFDDKEISETMFNALVTNRNAAALGKPVKGWHASELMIQRLKTREQRDEARDILRGMLGKTGLKMSDGVRTASSLLLALNVITYLSLATLASLPDLAGGVLRSKDLSAFRTAFQEMKYYFNNREEMQQYARDVGITSLEAMSEMSVNAGEMAYMSPGIEKVTNKFFHVIGLEAFTKFTRVFALGMGERFLINEANKANNPKLDQVSKDRAIRYLDELGVTAEDVTTWQDSQPKDGSRRTFAGASGTKIESALGQFVNESIVRPNSAERPGWASNPYAAVIWQLKSFFYAYGKNLVGGAIRETNARYAETGKVADAAVPMLIMATAFIPMTMLGLELREWLKYAFRGGDETAFATDSMSYPEYAGDVTDRSGLLGPYGLIIPMLEAGQFGGSWWIPPLGPTAERIEDLAKGDVDWSTYLPFVSSIGGSSFR